MVRRSSDIWQLFVIEKTDKKSKAVCKFCCFKYAFPNATRMTNHILNQCSKCPLEIAKETGTYISNELIKVIQDIEPQFFFNSD
ncbi:unnamed protein product [Acanthoscelides obtectus]|uniref:BED-type domain-containing protein n=1 Tax=Acanthoscelides obtectus TaxID=200917 RepID=A0A9P0MMK4_ACAOB|nr:unnamed protein product [Acanthoscelides obtectus]CAK1676041.1 hypothetical protein AOBTE_LOCUS30560 [Acanthoscelides obtectus]